MVGLASGARAYKEVVRVTLAILVGPLLWLLAVGVVVGPATATASASSPLLLTKTGPPLAAPGAAVVYRLGVTNTAALTATAVVVTDTLPAFINFDQAGSGTWDAPSRTASWALGSLAPGASAWATVTGTLSAVAPVDSDLVNLAAVTALLGVTQIEASAAFTTTVYFPPAAAGELAVEGGLAVGLPITLTATLRDAQGQPVPDGTLALFSAPSPASITPSAITSNGLARATVQTTRSGRLTVNMTSAALTLSRTLDIEAGPVSQLYLKGTSHAPVGQPVQLTALLSDTYGNPALPVDVQFNLNGVGQVNPTRVVAVDGVAQTTLTSTARGWANVTALAGSRQMLYRTEFLPLAPSQGRLAVVEQAVAGLPFALRASLKDLYSNPVGAGHPVQFSVVSGNANLAPTEATTDASGYATTTLSTPVAAPLVVRAQSGAARVDETVEVSAGPAVRLQVAANPTAVGVDGGQTQITARAVDANGNVVPSRGGVVFFNISSPLTGTLSPPTATLVSGVAQTTLTAPNRRGPSGETSITVKAGQGGLQEGETTVQLQFPALRVEVVTVPPLGLDGYALPGQTVTYAITVRNTGAAPARNVVLDSTLMDRFINWQVTLPPGVTTLREPAAPGETWQWSLGTLNAGQQGVITVTGRLNPAAAWQSQQTLESRMTLSATTLQGAGGAPNASLLLPVRAADLVLEVLTPSENPTIPGADLPIKILIGNNSRAVVNQARITVTLPISTSFVSWEEINPAYLPPASPPGYLKLINPVTGSPIASCNQPECVWLYSGEPLQSTNANSFIQLRLNVSAGAKPDPNAMRMTTRLSGPIYEAAPNNNTVITLIPLYGMNLSPEAEVDGAVKPGREFTLDAYSFNRGVARPPYVDALARDVTLTVTVPSLAEVQSVESAIPHTRIGQTLVWFFPGDLPANSLTPRARIRLKAAENIPAGTVLTSTIQTTTATAEPFRADNTRRWTTRIIPDDPNRVALEPVGGLTLRVDESRVLTARAFDRNNNAVPGWLVQLNAQATSGTPLAPGGLTPTAGQTGVTGALTATVTAGTTPGTATVTARIQADQTYTASLPVTVLPGLAADMSSGIARTLELTAGTPFTVTLRDRYGNPVQDGTQVTLTTTLGRFEGAAGAPRLAYATTTGGLAQVTFRAETQAGLARVSACASPSLCEVRTVVIQPGPAASVNLSLSAAQARAGDGPIELSARVADAFGNSVADRTEVNFSLAGCPTASLQATRASTIGGLATTALIGGTRACVGSVTANVGGAWSPQVFSIVPSDPAYLRLSAPDTLIASGFHMGTVRVELTDVYSNGIHDAAVSLRLNPVQGTLSPSTVSTVNGVGQATLTAPRGLATVLLTAQAGPLSQSKTVSFVAGPTASLGLAPGEPTLPANGEATVRLRITGRDAYDNPTNSPITLASSLDTSLTPGSGALTEGTFDTELRAGTRAGRGVITATTESVVTVFPVRLTAGAPVFILPSFSRFPARLVADGQDSLALSARILDTYGNPVENGTPVTFTISPPRGRLAPDQGVTTGGRVTTTLTAGLETGQAQITIDAGARPLARTVEFTVGPPFSLNLALSRDRLLTPEELTATLALTVTVADLRNRPVAPGTIVTFEVDRGSLTTSLTKRDNGAEVEATRTLTVTTDTVGRAYARFIPSGDGGTFRVTARAGTVSQTRPVLAGDRPYWLFLPLVRRGS